ncbi:MAG TPA: AAA family ATPase [Thermoanaerobaculia bacterium]|nr:AAA family ATPase [Thermoanaerobaculia bacterium]
MPRATNRALRFTRIQLKNWRNFRTASVDLQGRVFLVGPNASGKSNFLDAFRFLRDIAREGLQHAVSQRGGVSRVRSLDAPPDSEVSISVAIGTEDQPETWEYEIRFGEHQRRAVLATEKVRQAGTGLLSRPDSYDRQDSERLTQTALEQVSMNKDFREIADFFSTVFYLHVVPQLVREPERSAGRHADPFGGDFLEQIADVPEDLLEQRLAWVSEAVRAAIPQLVELDVGRDVRGMPHLMGRSRPGGPWQTEAQLSDGTLRLIGLLWAHLVEPSGPLILEEPELGLHPEVVRHLPQVFARMQSRSGQQILLSTHSPDLLRDEGIGLNEVLLLLPGKDGSEVRTAGSFREIVTLLEGGIPLDEAVLPLTRPEGVETLDLRIER